MNDKALLDHLGSIRGEEPADEFVRSLRTLLEERSLEDADELLEVQAPALDTTGITVVPIDVDEAEPTPLRRVRLVPAIAAAAAVFFAVVFVFGDRFVDDASQVDTASTTVAQQVGKTWLDTILTDDRDGFASLHAVDVDVNDTLIGYSQDAQFLTPDRVGELYLAGFDAFQASLVASGSAIQTEGCFGSGRDMVRCSYTVPLGEGVKYSYTVVAEITVEDRLIAAIDFVTTTEPTDLRSEVEQFFGDEGTPDDVACMVLGFNTVGCGEHDADFMARYLRFYEARQVED